MCLIIYTREHKAYIPGLPFYELNSRIHIFVQKLSRKQMSKHKIETFGTILRKLREKKKMPLRKLASLLDLDQSTLSKIERDERSANLVLIGKIAKIFKVNRKDMQVNFLSDKVAYKLLDEEFSVEILHVAEEKIKYLRKTIGNS